MPIEYTPEELKLAREIAQTLNDTDSLPMHLILVRKHTETFLREKLNKVMSIPESEIRKTRGALYIFLINNSNRHGDTRH